MERLWAVRVLVCMFPCAVWPHAGDGRAVQMPVIESLAAQVDLADGSVADWRHLVGEPSLRAEDFYLIPDELDGYLPSTHSAEFWLAVDPAGSRIYLAMERWDDEHSVGLEDGYVDGMLELIVDGDHSGGSSDGSFQRCVAYVDSAGRFRAEYRGQVPEWLNDGDYVGGSGIRVTDSGMTYTVVEMYMTMFDSVASAPEISLLSSVGSGVTVGFGLIHADLHDRRLDVYETSGVFPDVVRHSADDLGHALVAGRATQVRSVPWSRVKTRDSRRRE